MKGIIVEVRGQGEFLVVVSKRGYRLVSLKTFELSDWRFKDGNEIFAALDIVSYRVCKEGREDVESW